MNNSWDLKKITPLLLFGFVLTGIGVWAGSGNSSNNPLLIDKAEQALGDCFEFDLELTSDSTCSLNIEKNVIYPTFNLISFSRWSNLANNFLQGAIFRLSLTQLNPSNGPPLFLPCCLNFF